MCSSKEGRLCPLVSSRPRAMDSLTFDGYTSYSDASTPRTPSPTDMHFAAHHHKHDIDQQPIRGTAIFTGGNDDTAPDAHYWQAGGNAFFANSNGSRGSLLQDVYEHDTAEFHTPQEQAFQGQQGADWDPHGNGQHRPGDFAMMRRATFPYVRHDREDGGMPIQQYPPFMQQQQQQQQQMLHQQTDNMLYSSRQDSGYPGESFISSSPHSSYNEFDDGAHSIKLEDSSSQIMVPSQTTNGGAQPGFYHRPHSNSSAGIAGHPHGHPHAHQHPHHQHHQQQHQLAHHNPHMTLSYLSPHTGLPVQHTDDAASKETQYLRRRCFNCHTTEPPSWRRSTLNPGKIVCNKCGLYERTHLRPRPLRFDELRAGNKARKASKGTAAAAGNGGVSPKQSKMLVKKEPREYGGGSLVRRSSVSSNSSVHSSSGASDWDDNGVYNPPSP